MAYTGSQQPDSEQTRVGDIIGTISIQQPQIGQPDTTEDPKIQANFTAIAGAINGGIDSTNLSALAAQSAGVNQSGQTVKGVSNISSSQSVSNVAYSLMPTPDQVAGITLPANGLIRVWYQAQWQESVSGAARAAIFIGSNQLQVQQNIGTRGPAAEAAYTGGGLTATLYPLATCAFGLVSQNAGGAFAADVTTGQAVGMISTSNIQFEIGGTTETTVAAGGAGGPCDVFAAAGTYTISVQFKASSGTVTAQNRKLYAQAISFA